MKKFELDYETVEHDWGTDVADIIFGEALPEFVREATRLLKAAEQYTEEGYEGDPLYLPQVRHSIRDLKRVSVLDHYLQGLVK